jgi:hypothetical protein
MAVALSDLRLYGSDVMADDDTPTAIGGAIDLAVRVVFNDVNGSMQLVSDSASDTTPTVTVSYRDSVGAIQTEVKTLNGLTPVVYTAVMNRLLKAVKSSTTVGNIAVEDQTAMRSNTATAGTANDITLDASASAVDDAYRGMIIRLTGGTGSGQIRQILSYNGTTKVAIVSRAWSVTPDATSVFRIATGFFFERNPDECLSVRRIFYDAAADGPGGSALVYNEKVFFKNCHATDDFTSAQIIESADPTGLVTFALETTLDGTGTNGANNRKVAPVSGIGSYDSVDKSVTGGTLPATTAQGVWLKLSLAAGQGARNSSYTLGLIGNS